MKSKILNFILLLTSLIGYLEWGDNRHMFLFQAEGEILSKLVTDPLSVIHPFTLLPLAGQILLFITLFQNKPNKVLTYISIGSLGILLAFMLVVGVMSLNYKIIASTIPFLLVSAITILHHRKNK
ncbi:MAG: hypothetical protein IPP71_03605 [Bacteroidetes bacterium]|nr:hypothetical protein [Bacteroidota bacterium]